MTKILFVTPVNPEKANAGDTKYTWDILNALKCREGMNVHVITFLQEGDDRFCGNLEKLVDRVIYVPFRYKSLLKMNFSKYPAMLANRRTPEMIYAVREAIRVSRYDAVVVNMFKLAYLVEELTDFPINKIFISHNVEFEVTKSTVKYAQGILWKVAYAIDYFKTIYWEKRLLPKFNSVSCICDYDYERYLSLGWNNNLFILRPVVKVPSNISFPNHTRTMIVCGTFTWAPKKSNLNMLLDAANRAALAHKDTKLLVVGRVDYREKTKGNSIPNVIVTGAVESVDPYYDKSEIAIVPELAGGGFKLKIGEAIQHSLPIVAIKGSITDKGMIPGIHYLEADNFDDLLAKANRLIDDIDLQLSLIEASSALFRSQYSQMSLYQSFISHLK